MTLPDKERVFMSHDPQNEFTVSERLSARLPNGTTVIGKLGFTLRAAELRGRAWWETEI
jgi:hypothetical protein